VAVNVKELSENEAPIAFVIKSHSWSEMDFTPIDIEIRLYNGNLYQIKKCSEVLSGGKGNMPIEHLQQDFHFKWLCLETMRRTKICR